MRIVALLKTLGDILFPPRSTEQLVRSLTTEDVRTCYTEAVVRDVTALSSFSDARMRALIHEAKYVHNEDAQVLLATLIHMYCERHPAIERAVFIPVPLSHERMRSRGYNQVTKVLARAGIEPHTEILERVRHTRPQTELGRAERLTNMHNAFVCTKPETVRGNDIVLVDDVVTTGATLEAAKGALLQHAPRSITLLALAH